MALNHGAIVVPTGVTAVGVLVHEKRTRIEDVMFESMDNAGAFQNGKSIRKKTSHTTSGESLTTLALPTVGSGAATTDDPHIDITEQNEKNEGATDFTIEDHEFSAGEGDFSA